jgi:hypothetical protein
VFHQAVNALLHDFGLDDASGAWYLFWSGIFGDVAIFAAAVGLYRSHNCHVKGCLRIGKHKVDGTPYTVCGSHHPEVDGRVTHEHVTRKLRRHRANHPTG